MTKGFGREDTSVGAWLSVLTSVGTSGVHCRGEKARDFPFDDEVLVVNTFSLLTWPASFGRLGAGGCAPSGPSIDWRLREGRGPSMISMVGSRHKSM